MSAAQQVPSVWYSPSRGVVFARPPGELVREAVPDDLAQLPEDAILLVPEPRTTSGPRVWSEDDFAQLAQDDPPTQKLPDTDLMCGRVRQWVWRVREDLTMTRTWRETAERGRWTEAKP